MKMKHEMRGENDRSQVKAERTCIYKLDADPTLENSTPLKGASYHHIFIYFFFSFSMRVCQILLAYWTIMVPFQNYVETWVSS